MKLSSVLGFFIVCVEPYEAGVVEGFDFVASAGTAAINRVFAKTRTDLHHGFQTHDSKIKSNGIASAHLLTAQELVRRTSGTASRRS